MALSYRKILRFLPGFIYKSIPDEEFGNVVLHNYYDFSGARFPSRTLDRMAFFFHFVLKGQIYLLVMLDRWLAGVAERYRGRCNERNPISAKNLEIQGKHIGQRCFVISNGPSIGEQDLSLLANEFTIVTNSFWRHPVVDQWQPTYYCIADAVLFKKQPVGGAEGYSDSHWSAASEDFFRNLRNRIRSSKFIVPMETTYEAVEETGWLPMDRTYFVPFFPFPVFQLIPEFPNLARGLPWIQNVGQWAILVAMAMGFKEIVLLGYDHDWFIAQGETKHFFKGPVLQSLPGMVRDSRRDPNYFKRSRFVWIMWRGYRMIQDLAKANGVRIVNASGGILDVFPRENYEKILGTSPPLES